MGVEINEEKGDKLDEILENFQYRKAMKITAWVMRLIGNCRSKEKERLNGPLTTKQVNDHELFFYGYREFILDMRALRSVRMINNNWACRRMIMECMFLMVEFKENTQFICLPLHCSVKDW